MKSTIKIALYFFSLANAGGAERISTWLINEFARRGHNVHLISWDIESTSSFYQLDKRVTWHQLGIGIGLINKFKRTYSLYKTLKTNSIDVFIGFVMSGDKSVFTAVKAAGIPLVVAERNAPAMYKYRHSRLQRIISFVMMRLSNVIVVQFPRFITGYPRYLRRKIITIPNPIEIPDLQAAPDKRGKNNRFSVLSVSRFDETQKNISCLLKAFDLVKESYPDWELRIIGDGPDKREILSLADHLELGSRVIIEMPRASIFEAYLNSHLFVIPSLWEGFPNALAEAMAHGLPAIGFEGADGVTDLITDGKDGWLVKGLNNENNLACALSEAMENAKERARRGELARQSMQEYKMINQFIAWEKVLVEILA